MDTMRYTTDGLELLDQTLLPLEIKYITCKSYTEVAKAIKKMQVRGAPAIGAAAAFGLALAAKEYTPASGEFGKYLFKTALLLKETRPTAVNLFWAIDRMLAVYAEIDEKANSVVVFKRLEEEAQAIFTEDIAANMKMGFLGAELLPTEGNILTHCNAGALATAGYGTALGVIRAAVTIGKKIHVYADETRPLLQGARLTVFELMQDNIPVTLITDNMAAYLMGQGKISAVIVGADRIVANGDAANKIGTYGLAVLAHFHHIPFYIAAPWSTVDMGIAHGKDIPIEERDEHEVRCVFGHQVAPHDVAVYNPAFDVTPHGLISAIITERGIVRSPYHEGLKRLAFKKMEVQV